MKGELLIVTFPADILQGIPQLLQINCQLPGHRHPQPSLYCLSSPSILIT